MVKHYANVAGMAEELKADPDHCYCDICNHRSTQTCIEQGCTCCTTPNK